MTWLLMAGSIYPLQAEERITEFFSDIEIHSDGAITVIETINVIAEGEQIRRGIYRDFPTRYQAPGGGNHQVGFDLVEVKRDNRPEPYHTEQVGNGIRIYIGQRNVFLEPGQYSYQITYRTTRQLGFYDNHDELYWNVTGNDWAFPISRVEARVVLPESVSGSQLVLEGYTGYSGERGQNFISSAAQQAVAQFATTIPLQPRQGFTIVVQWPKGHVSAPSGWDRINYFFADYRIGIITVGAMIILLVYYLVVWIRVGRDPQKGVVIPLFSPPGNLSPAASRYVYRMGFDNRCYAAAIINMAVKGFLSIEENDGTYTLIKGPEANDRLLSAGEQNIARTLFAASNTQVLEKANHRVIKKSVNRLKTSLKREYHQSQFMTNTIYLVPGFFISLLSLMAVGFSTGADTAIPLVMMSVWLTGWTFTIFMLIRQQQKLMAAIFSIFGVFSVAGTVVALSAMLSLLMIGLIGVNILFYYLMKAPTESGRKLMDRLEGFRMYLGTAEEHRLNTLNPPEHTLELFEKFLPYALALGVDQAWSEKFASTLVAVTATEEGGGYRPGWYHGPRLNRFNPAGFSSSLGPSLAKAVSSSSSAPGSASGGGGGGSTGGGGGGGGGGGW
jgi:uncharacterized membrane protein